jgi:Protein of unknown function (DUF732)
MRGGHIAPIWWISHSACWATWRSGICTRTDALRVAGTAASGELVELGHSICGLLADGYSMNATTGMGNLYAGSGMTPDDAKFVVQMSAAAYCPKYVQ